jgi:hypothetical protein
VGQEVGRHFEDRATRSHCTRERQREGCADHENDQEQLRIVSREEERGTHVLMSSR